MAYIPDDYDRFRDEEDREPDIPYVTCRRCGTGRLHWRQVTAPDGRSEKPHLFDDQIRRHVCQQPTTSDFEAL